MGKALRVSVTLLATLAFTTGLAACGDDDETADATTTTTTTTTVAGDEGEGEEGEGEEGGAPDVNPCAEGESGEFGPPAAEPADGATEVTVTATDYDFEGFEALSEAGEYAITFTNEGEELHEMVLMRLSEDETRTIEELLSLPEEEQMALETEDVAFVFACPGDTAEPVGATLEPGRHMMICFIPVGADEETDPAEFENLGPPHFSQGMVHEFEVS
jgi:hypothetical protein